MIQGAFASVATPPGVFNGALVNKNENLPVCLHFADKSSGSNISPIMTPQHASNYWCKISIVRPCHASKAG